MSEISSFFSFIVRVELCLTLCVCLYLPHLWICRVFWGQIYPDEGHFLSRRSRIQLTHSLIGYFGGCLLDASSLLGQQQRDDEWDGTSPLPECVLWVCVCVCVGAPGRLREKECVCVCFIPVAQRLMDKTGFFNISSIVSITSVE